MRLGQGPDATDFIGSHLTLSPKQRKTPKNTAFITFDWRIIKFVVARVDMIVDMIQSSPPVAMGARRKPYRCLRRTQPQPPSRLTML